MYENVYMWQWVVSVWRRRGHLALTPAKRCPRQSLNVYFHILLPLQHYNSSGYPSTEPLPRCYRELSSRLLNARLHGDELGENASDVKYLTFISVIRRFYVKLSALLHSMPIYWSWLGPLLTCAYVGICMLLVPMMVYDNQVKECIAWHNESVDQFVVHFV